MQIIYKCSFNFKDNIAVVVGTEVVFEFKDGFWITGGLQLTKVKDGQYWIPPSQLRRIEREVML